MGLLMGPIAEVPLSPRERAGALEEIGRSIRETHRDPVLQALHVGSGAQAIGATQAEIDDLTRDL